MPSVSLILQDKKPTMDGLARMIKDVTPFPALYNYDTIALFFEKSQRIYDSESGMYYYDDYFAPGFLEQLHEMQPNDTWLFHISPLRYYGGYSETELLTYIRKLPIYETDLKGYICVSLSLDYLQETAAASASGISYPAAVYLGNHLIWCSSSSKSGIQCSVYVTKLSLVRSIFPDWAVLLTACSVGAAAAFLLSVVYTVLMLRRMDTLMGKA